MYWIISVCTSAEARRHAKRLYEKRDDAKPIFNPDDRRLNIGLSINDPAIQTLLRALEREGKLEGRTIGRKCLVFSDAGCLQQQMHYDITPDRLVGLTTKPCAVLLALQAHTRLITREHGTIRIPTGKALVYESDMAHAGAAYENDNVRIHLYLNTEGVLPLMQRVTLIEE